MSASVLLSVYASYGVPPNFNRSLGFGSNFLFGSPTSYNFSITIASISGTPDANQRVDVYNHVSGVLLGSIPLTPGASFSSSASNFSIRVENVVSVS